MERNDLIDFLANFYQVRVVYYADQEVDNICRKLTGCSMPEKFSVFIDNAYVRDVVNGSTTGTVQRRIGFRFIDARTLSDYNTTKYDQTMSEWYDDESASLSPFMCAGVGHAYSPEAKAADGGKLMASLQSCPWYSAYRSAVIETSEASDVEFLSSCVSCVFLTSEMAESPSSNLVNLAKQHDERSTVRLSSTNSPQNVSPATPVGPSRHLLMPCPRCCAVVFSPSSTSDTGTRLGPSIEQARTVLPGLMCQAIPFVAIDNSASAKPSALIAGLFARLARDVVLPSLLSWSERHITQLAELLNSRRGISTSLRGIFSAGSKPSAKITLPSRGSSGTLTGSNGQAQSSADVVYTDESAEIQLRRLSDVALLMGAFDIAFEGYHRLKDDFQRDQALLPQATALEAAAVALLLHPQPPSRRYPATCLKYLENALSLYQSLASSIPRAQYLATRCGLLYADTLRSLKLFPEAAAAFARLAPEISSPLLEFELRSAICLEQAAQCWAALRPNPKMRKAALNLLLAGARYSRAGRRRHALRCYQNALPTYAGRGLALAEDHVLLTIGRQSFALRDLRTAVEAFAGLLCHAHDTRNQHQNAITQAGFLREYLYVARRFQEAQSQSGVPASENVVIAPIPNFPSTCLLIDPSLANQVSPTGVSLPGADDWQVFASLEDAAVKALINSVVFRPATFLFNSKVRGNPAKAMAPESPSVFVDEEFLVLVLAENPLDIPVMLVDIALFGSLESESSSPDGSKGSKKFGHREEGSPVVADAPRTLELQPRQTARFVVRLKCSIAGKLKVSDICANLSTSVPFDDQGNTSVHAHWSLDAPWLVDVCESSGCVSVQVKLESDTDKMTGMPSSFIPGTLVPMKINFQLGGDRAGSDCGIKSLVLTTNRSDCVQLLDGSVEIPSPPPPPTNSGNNTPVADTVKSWRVLIPESASATPSWSLNAIVRVAPNSAESTSGMFSFSLLVAYEPVKRTGKRKYRLSPVLIKLSICETPFLLSVAAMPHPSSPVGLLNIRDCLQFSLGFSASLMAATNENQQRPAWSLLHLHRLALISSSINVDGSKCDVIAKEEENFTSTSRIVNTVVIARREKPLPDAVSTPYVDLLSHCSLSTIIQQSQTDLSKDKLKNGLDLQAVTAAIVRMGLSAHRPSVFSNVSSASRLHGIFVFQWLLASGGADGSVVRGCNFVVDPPMFSGDQFSSAVFAASDPGMSARRLAFGMARLSTLSVAGITDGGQPSPVVVHLEYPQVVDMTTSNDDDENELPAFRINATVFCRNRSTSRVELVDCTLPVPCAPGSNEDSYGSSGLLWLAPQPIWPVSLEPGDAVSIPLVLLATHPGVFRPLPPTVEFIVPPSSSKTSVRPDFGPFIHINYDT